jgi:hypothetical protein
MLDAIHLNPDEIDGVEKSTTPAMRSRGRQLGVPQKQK